MKKLTFLFTLLCFSVSFSQSNSFKISGSLISEDDKTPLESATIYLERVVDSSLVTYTISDKNGKFLLQEKTYDKSLNLTISYVGFQSFTKKVLIDKETIDLGVIELKTANLLDEVVIKSRAPITIKKDTLEFNVSSFKTKKDANVEDLLKELPGVEVDDEGKIKVNGKEVNKILVNGKPFFGDDPTITTRNLTKEIIEKVQITDTKTDSEAFSGEEGDKDNKTINLTIKEENNKGTFGRLSAGVGTDERYELAGMINFFDNDQRISVLAGGNNTNSPGFSFGEIQKMFGGGRSMMMMSNGSFAIDGRSFGGGQGIVTSENIGANYADELSKGVDISADYFLAASSSEEKSKTNRENILPDSRYYTNSSSISSNDSDNHSANLKFDIEIDSTFLINVSPRFRFSKGKNIFNRDEQSLDEANTLTNESTTSSFVETTSKNIGNDLDITKRFGSDGAFLKSTLNLEYNNSETDNFLNSETNIYGDNPNDIIRNQFTDGEQTLKSIYTSLTYRLPLISKTLFLDFKYSLRSDKRESIRSTYDFDSGSQEYSLFNGQLSTNFNYENRRHTPSLDVTYRKEKWSISVDAGYVFRTLKNSDRLRPNLSLEQDFKALEIGANFDYQFSPKASMYSGYNLRNQPPQIDQLQPFQDVSDPLNTVTGNPNLEPSNSHSLYFGYNSFDFQSGSGFYSYVSANLTNNQVVSKTTIDDDLVKNTTYTNVNGVYSVYTSANYSKTVKLDTLRTLKYRIGLYSNTSRNINFNNDVKYASTYTTVTPNASVTFNWKKIMEIVPNYRLSFTNNVFDLDGFDNQNFVSHTLGVRTTTFVPKKFEWRNDINFNYNPNIASGFQKSAWFWNSTLAYSMLKDKGTLTLKVYDLLNQNTNAVRTATANYIQDSQSTVLQQYFMVSFSWKFNSLGQKGETGNGDIFFFD